MEDRFRDKLFDEFSNDFIKKNIQAVKNAKRRSITPPPARIVKPKKGIPKEISGSSHLLAPTVAYLLKKIDRDKKEITKSKSSTDLLTSSNLKNSRDVSFEKQKPRILSNEFGKISDFDLVYDEDPSPEPSPPIRVKKRPIVVIPQNISRPSESFSPFQPLVYTKPEPAKSLEEPLISISNDPNQTLSRKASNPKNLEIDTEKIEDEYVTPKEYEPLPIDYIRVDTLNFYSSHFSIREAIVSDILTGKIFLSQSMFDGINIGMKCKGIRHKYKDPNQFDIEMKPESSDFNK